MWRVRSCKVEHLRAFRSQIERGGERTSAIQSGSGGYNVDARARSHSGLYCEERGNHVPGAMVGSEIGRKSPFLEMLR